VTTRNALLTVVAGMALWSAGAAGWHLVRDRVSTVAACAMANPNAVWIDSAPPPAGYVLDVPPAPGLSSPVRP